MNNLTLTTQYDTNATLISNIFIDRYMPHSNGEFVKIYLYLLRSVSDASCNISISGMADIFNQTETDVIRALKYWSKNGVISLSFDDTDNKVTGISLCNLAVETPVINNAANLTTDNSLNTAISTTSGTSDLLSGNAQLSTMSADYSSANTSTLLESAASESSASREVKTYTPAQIQELSAQDVEFQMLLRGINNYLGGALTSSEISSIAYFYDSLKFPSDLIEYLIEYCATKGHKKMRYIEKVALAWADAGITTVKQAKTETITHNETTYSVMNAFGLTNRDPGQRERDYIAKWTNVYGFGTDIIIEACNRTLKATHQPSFEYADSILSKWEAANIHTQADILKADAEYELSRSARKKNNTAKNPNNRFNNFDQRNTDIDSLESSLLNSNS